MAVTECKLVKYTGSASFDERNLGTYELEWTVTTDPDLTVMGPQEAANGALLVGPNPLPSLWSTYAFLGDSDAYSYLRRVVPKRWKNNHYKFSISGTYLPLQPGEVYGAAPGTGYNEPNPVNRPPVWSGDGEVYTKLITEDKDGAALLTAAGMPFDPTLDREETRCVAIATKNYATLAEVFTLMATMTNAVNDDTWQGQAARTVLCREVVPQSLVTEGPYSYYPVACRFVIREDGKTWDDKILEQGWSYLTTGSDFGTRVDVDGPEPVLLNADGTKRDTGVGLFTEKRTFREVDFATELGF